MDAQSTKMTVNNFRKLDSPLSQFLPVSSKHGNYDDLVYGNFHDFSTIPADVLTGMTVQADFLE